MSDAPCETCGGIGEQWVTAGVCIGTCKECGGTGMKSEQDELVELVAKAIYEGYPNPIYRFESAPDLKKAQCRFAAKHVLTVVTPVIEQSHLDRLIAKADKRFQGCILTVQLSQDGNLNQSTLSGWLRAEAAIEQEPTHG